MKSLLYVALLAGLCIGLRLLVDSRPPAVNPRPTDDVVPPMVVPAVDLAEAFSADPQKAGRDFGPKRDGPIVQITGRVISTLNGEALLTNENSDVRVYVGLGAKQANIGDLVDAAVKKLTYSVTTRSVKCESANVTVARYEDAVPIRPNRHGLEVPEPIEATGVRSQGSGVRSQESGVRSQAPLTPDP